jgi:deoxycytidylate deaminase
MEKVLQTAHMLNPLPNKTCYRLCASTFSRDRKLITSEFNDYHKSHPIQKFYAEKANLPDKIYLHAEMLAVLNSRDHNAHSLYVARALADGKPANAQPCKICMAMIRSTGIRRVYYTVDDGMEIILL